ncbi:MAG: ATP-binding protein, partial [Thermoplasmata archaeon]|nr:ATP-binding protein [Thermoplasmata archaeon]
VIERELMGQVEGSLKHEEVTVIKGVRRAGKTFILYHIFQKNGGVYINFEDERLYDFSLEDFEKLLDIVQRQKVPILYLDEVQHVQGWEKFAHRAHRKAKLFVTGSNSNLLSSDYAKTLVGRTKSFNVYPLSFSEFLRFKGKRRSRPSLLEYMETGGFPRIVITGDTSLAGEYLDRIIYRDILGTEKIRHPEAVRTLAYYLLSNVGKAFSFRSLTDICSLKHESTVKDYLGLLRDAYLIDIMNKYDPSLKAQESYGKKVFSIDPAFISLGKRRDKDTGRILENVVHLYLRRTHDDIFYGKNNREVDFIVCEGLKPLKVINVTLEATKEKTLEREVSSLVHFQDRLGVPGELVALYPCKLPEDIDFHLAHRYLA